MVFLARRIGRWQYRAPGLPATYFSIQWIGCASLTLFLLGVCARAKGRRRILYSRRKVCLGRANKTQTHDEVSRSRAASSLSAERYSWSSFICSRRGARRIGDVEKRKQQNKNWRNRHICARSTYLCACLFFWNVARDNVLCGAADRRDYTRSAS